MDGRNRLNPSVVESTAEMNSLDTAESRGGGGGDVEGRRERGSAASERATGGEAENAELIYLDEEDEEEAQLQEAIRLSMSEYERAQERRLLPPSSSSASSLQQQQQQASCRSTSCRHQEEEEERRGAWEGGEASSLSFLASEEDALQQAIQASLQDILGDAGAFPSGPGAERDVSSSSSSRDKARDRESRPGEGGGRASQGCLSSSSGRQSQYRRTEDTCSYLERSPCFSFSKSTSSSSSCLFTELFPSPPTSVSDDMSRLLLPTSSSSSSSSLSFSCEGRRQQSHSSRSPPSSSSSLQRKSENDICCAPLSWREEEEEEIQIQLQWYCLTTFFSSRSSSSSSSSSTFSSFFQSAREGCRLDTSPSEEMRECYLSCLVCRNLSFFEISLSRESRGRIKEGARSPCTAAAAAQQSCSSSSSLSSSTTSRLGKTEDKEEQGGRERSEEEEGGGENKKEKKLSPPLDFLYICDRCSSHRRGAAGVHTPETSEMHSSPSEAPPKTFMPRDFLSPDLPRNSSSSSSFSSSSSLSSAGLREKHGEKLREMFVPLQKDVLTSLLETVLGSRQTRAISTEGIKRWFEHPFLFGGDSVWSLFSSSSPSLSGESKKREEEERQRAQEEQGRRRREKERRERCLSANHPFFACPWGLVQVHGGPCGVLASVESFLLSSLFFAPSRSQRSRAFLQDAYAFLRLTEDREKERFLSSKIPGGAESSSSSVRVPFFCSLLSSLQKDAEAAQAKEEEEKSKEEEEEKESRDSSRCELSSGPSREGKKRRSEEREVCSSGEHDERNPKTQEGNKEEEEDAEKNRRKKDLFVLNPEFLASRGFTSLIRRHALIEALSSILFQCTYTSKYILAYAELNTPSHRENTSFSSSLSQSTSLLHKTFPGDRQAKEGEERRGRENDEEEDADYILRECIQVYVQQFDNIQKVMQFYWEYYDLLVESSSSVISFLFSVVLTRGIQRVCDDMDTRDHPLLGVYGHCSQELVNLLLLGMASSNVFDGMKDLGTNLPSSSSQKEEEEEEEQEERRQDAQSDAQLFTPPESASGVHAVLRGVLKRPFVGFLTEMEALRYCEVGSRYKNPFLPVWVLGSSSHYTTLFSRNLLVSYLSPPRLAEMEAQAAFRLVDEENNMYIRSQQLPSLLALLGIEERESEARRAIGGVDGVILWSEFLSWYSSLRTSPLQQPGSSSDDLSALESPGTFTVYFYDAQTPPGPCLRRFLIKLHEDADLRYSHQPESYELSRILWTRWNSAEVSQLSLLSPLLDLSLGLPSSSSSF